jgi:hypothetical protein
MMKTKWTLIEKLAGKFVDADEASKREYHGCSPAAIRDAQMFQLLVLRDLRNAVMAKRKEDKL